MRVRAIDGNRTRASTLARSNDAISLRSHRSPNTLSLKALGNRATIGIRTRGLFLTKEALYRWSYCDKWSTLFQFAVQTNMERVINPCERPRFCRFSRVWAKANLGTRTVHHEPANGFEPITFALQERCSAVKS